MSRKQCVVAVIENGETRCGLTTAFIGLGGIPYRLMKWASDEERKPLFEKMRLQMEISPEQYQEYLDHPENADDFSAMIEINVDQNIIHVDEDMGQEREYHGFPLDAFMEKAEQFHSSFTKSGPNAIRQNRIYSVMRSLEVRPPEPGMTMGGMS